MDTLFPDKIQKSKSENDSLLLLLPLYANYCLKPIAVPYAYKIVHKNPVPYHRALDKISAAHSY